MTGDAVQIISVVGSSFGFSSLLWLIVDWVRKDERQKQQAARIERMEQRQGAVELAHQQLQLQILNSMAQIKTELARIEGRDEGNARRRRDHEEG